MEDKFEKKIKSFLPYIIIIGVVYLFIPALMLIRVPAINYIILIGVLPLTALGCCGYYAMKKGSDFLLCLVAPIFFLITALLYGMFRDSVLNTLIYLAAYLMCGFLGLLVGDLISNRTKENPKASGRRPSVPAKAASGKRSSVPPKPVRRNPSPRPKRVAVDRDEEGKRFRTEDPYDDLSLDTSTTTEDIEAILSEIHSRRY